MMTIMMKVLMKVAHSGRSALSREHFSFFISLSFYNSYRNYGFRNISVACCGEKGHSQSIKLRGRQQQEEMRGGRLNDWHIPSLVSCGAHVVAICNLVARIGCRFFRLSSLDPMLNVNLNLITGLMMPQQRLITARRLP